MEAVWWAAAAVRPAVVGGKGSERDMFGRLWGREGWRRAKNGRVATAGRLGGMCVRGHSGRFETVDGDSIGMGTDLKAKGKWGAVEDQVRAVKERSERLGGAGTADKDMRGGLEGWGNCGRRWMRRSKIMAGRYWGKVLLASGCLQVYGGGVAGGSELGRELEQGAIDGLGGGDIGILCRGGAKTQQNPG